MAKQSHRCQQRWRLITYTRGSLSVTERRYYIQAVKCLMRQPSQLPPGLAAGAISRYDDITATHISMTLQIHGDGIFLTWHRHFVYLVHKELEERCGYSGTVPYWNCPQWAAELLTSPFFDGSPTSLSGDGDYVSNAEVPSFDNKMFPRGNGGGCVRTSPFAKLNLPFRNFAQNAVFEFNGTLPKNSLDYAPHCFRRELSKCKNFTTSLRPVATVILT